MVVGAEVDILVVVINQGGEDVHLDDVLRDAGEDILDGLALVAAADLLLVLAFHHDAHGGGDQGQQDVHILPLLEEFVEPGHGVDEPLGFVLGVAEVIKRRVADLDDAAQVNVRALTGVDAAPFLHRGGGGRGVDGGGILRDGGGGGRICVIQFRGTGLVVALELVGDGLLASDVAVDHHVADAVEIGGGVGQADPAVTAGEGVGEPQVDVVKIVAGSEGFPGKFREFRQVALLRHRLGGPQGDDEGHDRQGKEYHKEGNGVSLAGCFSFGSGQEAAAFFLFTHKCRLLRIGSK